MTQDEFKEKLISLVSDAVKEDVGKSGAICTNFVLVSEFMDEDGIYWSAIYKDDNLPPWRHVGLLYHALENGFNEGEDEDA